MWIIVRDQGDYSDRRVDVVAVVTSSKVSIAVEVAKQALRYEIIRTFRVNRAYFGRYDNGQDATQAKDITMVKEILIVTEYERTTVTIKVSCMNTENPLYWKLDDVEYVVSEMQPDTVFPQLRKLLHEYLD